MKYYININQLILSKTKLDIKDCAIIEYIKGWCSADDKKVKQLTLEEDGTSYRYTWLNFSHLINEMPLLKIKEKSAISRRIVKISKSGYIKTFKAPDNTLYVRLLPKIKELEFRDDTIAEKQQSVATGQYKALPESNSTNSILNKQYINNKERSEAPFILTKDFFSCVKSKDEKYVEFISLLVEKYNVKKGWAETEVSKFCEYWTE